jgi:hypothetical protein
MLCFGCGSRAEIDGRVMRGDVCAKCGRPLHCCRNCALYDPARHNKCEEPQAEWVADREAANFCEFFTPSAAAPAGGDRSTEARRKLDELFG